MGSSYGYVHESRACYQLPLTNNHQTIVYFLYRNSISDGARRWAKIAGILAAITVVFTVVTMMASFVFTIIVVVGAVNGMLNTSPISSHLTHSLAANHAHP